MNAPKSPTVPQSWWEWAYSVYDPDKWLWLPRWYVKTIAAAAGKTGTDDITMNRIFFCQAVKSFGFKTASGSAPSFPYRLTIEGPQGYQWTDDGVAAVLVTDDNPGTIQFPFHFDVPRELQKNDVVDITVDNTLNAADPITVDLALYGYEVLQRAGDLQIIRV